MPFRPGVDDNAALAALINVWRTAADAIDARLADVWDQIRRELYAEGPVNRNRVARLRSQGTRLQQLAAEVERTMAKLKGDTLDWITAGRADEIYAAGAAVTTAVAGIPFTFTIPHRAAMDVLAQDLYDDVLRATSFVSDDAKTWARHVSRRLTAVKVGAGDPVKAATRELAAELRAGFGRRGMGSVIYADGSRHSFGEYAEVLLRTKSGVIYNQGTLNHARAVGIRWYELLDGHDCGLTSHTDPQKANGLIVDADTAEAWPLAHPRCRRSVNPRPDLVGDDQSDAVSVQPPEKRVDQIAFERALAQQAAVRQAERTGRRERRARR